jgi:dihydroorotate dehydrogenase electron transfer subunit
MAEKKRCQAVVVSQDEIAQEIYSLWLAFPTDYNIAAQAVPGQFISMYCDEGSRLLPRPISICEIVPQERKLRVVYRIAGKGTKEFSQKKPGDTISVLGPLGNGFPLQKGKAILIGGGIGIPPMLQLAKTLEQQGCQVQAVLGYRGGDLFLKEEFERLGDVFVSTEDGSAGTKGNVIDAIRANALTADVMYACGPTPMLRGVKAFSGQQGIPAWISLEERMACGIGACLGCVCNSTQEDAHSHVHNKRICKDGPVFDAREIEI